jgi:hypothetical protein
VSTNAPPPVRAAGQRIAAGWFLGIVAVAILVFAWLRGAGRIAIPVGLALLAAYGVARFVRLLRAPVD